MAGRHTVEVATFGRFGAFALTLCYPTRARALKEAVADKLGLQPSSLPVFSLFEGTLARPAKVLQDDDPVPQGAQNLSLRRWCFDLHQETKHVRHDDVAIHLLYSEAVFLKDEGLLHPSEAEQEQLESLLDPSFPTERQFLELARTVEGYNAFTVTGCKLMGELASNDVTIPDGSVVTCTANLDKLSVRMEEGEHRQLEWPWPRVKRWKCPTSRLVKFEVCTMHGNAPILKWMSLEMVQAYAFLSASSKICYFLKDKEDSARRPIAAKPARLAGRPIDPLVEFVNSELFGELKFSAIGPKHS